MDRDSDGSRGVVCVLTETTAICQRLAHQCDMGKERRSKGGEEVATRRRRKGRSDMGEERGERLQSRLISTPFLVRPAIISWRKGSQELDVHKYNKMKY